MLYSVKMRAAQYAAHEDGGKHISGAERIVNMECVTTVINSMVSRAFRHSRGQADFIQIKVETVAEADIAYVPVLAVQKVDCAEAITGRELAFAELVQAGVSPAAAQRGITELSELTGSMRGAMLLCCQTGTRVDDQGQRGIRVSNMDIADEQEYGAWLAAQHMNNTHAREALVLASKVAWSEQVVAELCWSDDPEYTTGYVSSQRGYVRIPNLKQAGNEIGGRIFFLSPDCDVAVVSRYLQQQPVMVTVRKRELL